MISDLIVVAVFTIAIIIILLKRKNAKTQTVKRYLPVISLTFLVFAVVTIYTNLQGKTPDGFIDLEIYKNPLFQVCFGILIFVTLVQLYLEIRHITQKISIKEITKRQAVIEYIRLCVTLVILFALIDIFIYFFNNNSFKGLDNFHSFSEIFVSFIYYSVETFTTLGFGDIVPTTIATRLILIIEVLSSFTGIGLIASELVSSDFKKEEK